MIAVDWPLDGATLRLRANLDAAPAPVPPAAGRVIWGEAAEPLPGFGVLFTVEGK